MNKTTQKRVAEIADALDNAAGMFESMIEEVATFASEERERFDALGDKAQEGERGQKIEHVAERLQQCSEDAQQAFDDMTNAASELRALLDE